MSENKLIHGSAHDIPLQKQSVHCIVTSPPYFALRQYSGDQAVDWPEVEYYPMPGLQEMGYPPVRIESMTCDLGLEPTIEAYIGHLILCLREWHRVLRHDGTLWVNLGDSYAGSGGAHTHNHANPGISKSASRDGTKHKPAEGNGIKPKDQMMIPWRFYMAAVADGWYGRSDIVWAKGVSCLPDYAGSCMPQSVKDRPTSAHEFVFLLTKSPKYFYDHIAVRESLRRPEALNENIVFGGSNKNGANIKHGDRTTGRAYGDKYKFARNGNKRSDAVVPGKEATHRQDRPDIEYNDGRNLRDVWAINPRGYSGAHFACFPPALPGLCIKAGTSAHGCCSECGSPYERVTDRKFAPQPGIKDESKIHKASGEKGLDESNGWGDTPRGTVSHATVGWENSCDCAADVISCTVLDPFSGSGTTGQAALSLGRSYAGVDISQEYLEKLAPERMSGVQIMMGF